MFWTNPNLILKIKLILVRATGPNMRSVIQAKKRRKKKDQQSFLFIVSSHQVSLIKQPINKINKQIKQRELPFQVYVFLNFLQAWQSQIEEEERDVGSFTCSPELSCIIVSYSTNAWCITPQGYYNNFWPAMGLYKKHFCENQNIKNFMVYLCVYVKPSQKQLYLL